MTLSIHHIALKVADLGKCAGFCAEVLGLPEIKRHNDEKGALRSVWFDLNGAVLMLERGERGGEGRHLIALKIKANEREGWKARLGAAGVKITNESPYTIYFCDPEDNLFALSHYPEK